MTDEADPGPVDAEDIRIADEPRPVAIAAAMLLVLALTFAAGLPAVRKSLATGEWLVGLLVVVLLLRARSRRGHVEIVGDSIRIERRGHLQRVRVLRTPRICERTETEAEDGVRLAFATTHGWVWLRVADATAADRLLGAAHADPERVQDFLLAKWNPRPLLQTLTPWIAACVFLLTSAGLGIFKLPGLAIWGASLSVILAAQGSLRATRITIGREGLVLYGWRLRRIVRWSEVTDVLGPEAPAPSSWWTRTKECVTVQVGSTAFELWAAAPSSTSQNARSDPSETARLYDAIQRAREAAAIDDNHVARSLLRRGRSLDEWRRASHLGSSYRSESLGTGDLVEQLENPSLPGEARLGAALALASSRDPDALGRVRVIAQNTVDAPLGTALLRVADERFDAAALADFESAEPAPRTASVTRPEPSRAAPRARR